MVKMNFLALCVLVGMGSMESGLSQYVNCDDYATTGCTYSPSWADDGYCDCPDCSDETDYTCETCDGGCSTSCISTALCSDTNTGTNTDTNTGSGSGSETNGEGTDSGGDTATDGVTDSDTSNGGGSNDGGSNGGSNNQSSATDDSYVSSNESSGYVFDTSLNWLDGLFLAYGILVLAGIFFCFVIPCAPYKARCREKSYPAADLEMYKNILVEFHGYASDGSRSPKDPRSAMEAFFKHDLTAGKYNWHNDFWTDYFLHLRMEHPFLAIFCGHRLHPYSRCERLWTVLGVILYGIGFAVFVGFFNVVADIQDPVLGFLSGFVWDVYLGILITCVTIIFEVSATCSCAENISNVCVRGCCKNLGHCSMGLLVTSGIIWCAFWLYFLAFVNGEGVELDKVFLVFLVNFGSGLFISWFLMDFVIDYISFENEWRRQKGESGVRCIRCHKYFNTCCCMSWFFCFWPLYYCCCKRCCIKSEDDKLKEYPRQDGYVIGVSEETHFAVNYHEYELYQAKYNPHYVNGSEGYELCCGMETQATAASIVRSPDGTIMSPSARSFYSIEKSLNIDSQHAKTPKSGARTPRTPGGDGTLSPRLDENAMQLTITNSSMTNNDSDYYKSAKILSDTASPVKTPVNETA